MLDKNPLLSSYDLPPFSAIRTEHLVPAIEKIIADSRIKVTAIIASQTPYPTWDDLVLAMDELKARLDTSLQLIAIISSVTTQPGWRDAAKRCCERVMAYQAELARKSELFGLYQRLSHSEIAQQFDQPRQKVLQKILRAFHRAGVNLAPEQQQRLLALDSDIERHQDKFHLNVQQAHGAWSKHIEEESLLAGVPGPVKRRMAHEARRRNVQGWLVTLSEESLRGVLCHAENRGLRKEVWVAYQHRASSQGPHDPRLDNDEVLVSLLKARHDKARLLGYENFAQLALEGQMVKSTDQVSSFLGGALDRHRGLFEREARQLKALASQHDLDELKPWDYQYLTEKTRRQAGAGQEQLRAYLPLDSVLDRLCLFVQRLFGVDMLERADFDRWHEDVRLFEIREFGQAIGYLYVDPYQHDLAGATPHALGLRNRRMTAEGRPRLPIAVLRSELPPRDDDAPCLLDHHQLRRLMHEFGHCLQQLLTGEDYRTISGLDGLGPDTGEFSSQVLEQWCFSKDFLVWVSGHYQTREPISTDQAERFLAGIQVQTSWTTADSLLFMLFDFEAHRTFGDGRGALRVFEDANNKVDHLKWPEAVRPFNNMTGIASPYAARICSYRWSQVLAEEAFEKFIRMGVFDRDTGRAFREAFFTRSGSRSLVQSLELFLGAPYAGRLSASLGNHDAVLQADTAPDPSIPLVGQLHTSQQQMILLNDTVPQSSEVALQQLRYWLKRTFPAVDATIAVEHLSVRTRQEETVISSQSLADDADEPAIKQPPTHAIALASLFWKALAGKIDAGTLFRDPGQIDILVTQGDVVQIPADLNSQEAKQQFKTLISNTAMSFEPLLTQALDNFWNRPADFSRSRKVGEWLADEFAAQLRAQTDLHRLDATMSQPMHEALTKHALSAPDATSRAELAAKVRPGVYRLNMAFTAGADSVPLPCTVVLTQHDHVSESGTAVLYAPGHPLEIYDNLAALKAGLIEGSLAWEAVSTEPLTPHFLTHLVADLRATQKTIVRDILLEGPETGEEVAAWSARIDRAAGVGAVLDLAGVLDEREFQRELKKQNEWLHGNPQVTGHDRREWWKAVRDLYEAQQIQPSPPDPVTLATEDAVSEWSRKRLARLITEKGYVAADPDQVFLSINRYIVDPHAPAGTSPWESGVSQGTKGIVVYRQSMTQWAMSNLTSEERSVTAPFLEGPMTYDQFKNVIEQANVGARILIELPIMAREQQTEWMALKAKQIRAQAWSAHISGDFRQDKDNTGLNLVLAALGSPTPEGRRKVNTHEVVVRQLKWGDSVLKDILAFGSASLASRPSLTLYTPGAPDNKMFRDLDAGNVRELERALAKALTATPEMTQWLISQLPLVEQAYQADSLTPTSTDLTLDEKIRKITQAVFRGWARSRAPADFASKLSWAGVDSNLLNVLHETQVSHAVKTADALTLSNAERDSADAQAGRRNAVALLTGAMSMFPASRLGGLLGRAILPVMTGGAAIAAIKSEGASFDQWLTDFISGLGEVLAEGART
ncbi:M3 family metallopeptidase [Pseudomonas sp. Z1-6]|uniref:M3 family metallopeptidase n=1 Tax=unclassified Pseudomonas TaxID=196821 RepID=UPI003DA8ABD6